MAHRNWLNQIRITHTKESRSITSVRGHKNPMSIHYKYKHIHAFTNHFRRVKDNERALQRSNDWLQRGKKTVSLSSVCLLSLRDTPKPGYPASVLQYLYYPTDMQGKIQVRLSQWSISSNEVLMPSSETYYGTKDGTLDSWPGIQLRQPFLGLITESQSIN